MTGLDETSVTVIKQHARGVFILVIMHIYLNSFRFYKERSTSISFNH